MSKRNRSIKNAQNIQANTQFTNERMKNSWSIIINHIRIQIHENVSDGGSKAFISLEICTNDFAKHRGSAKARKQEGDRERKKN